MEKAFDNFHFSKDLIHLLNTNAKLYRLKPRKNTYYSYDVSREETYFLLSGTIKITLRNKGKELFLCYLNQNHLSITNGFTLFNNSNTTLIVQVIEDVSLLKVSNKLILEWSKQFKELQEHIIYSNSILFHQLSESLINYTSLTTDERIYDYLKKEASLLKTNEFKISLHQISQDLNIRRETASKLLKKLTLKKIITKKKNSNTILIH